MDDDDFHGNREGGQISDGDQRIHGEVGEHLEQDEHFGGEREDGRGDPAQMSDGDQHIHGGVGEHLEQDERFDGEKEDHLDSRDDPAQISDGDQCIHGGVREHLEQDEHFDGEREDHLDGRDDPTPQKHQQQLPIRAKRKLNCESVLINIRITGAIVSLVIPVSMQVGHRGVLKWGVLAQRRLPYSKVILIHIYHVKCEAISNLEFKQMQSNKKALD